MKLKSILATILLTATLLTSTAFATSNPTSFSDIPQSHWAHKTIMKSVDLGLFSGTTKPDENGVGQFSPDSAMTREMFLVVTARGLKLEVEEGGHWSEGAISALIQNGVIQGDDFNREYNKPMTRQEMAYVLSNALEFKGDKLNTNISKDRIPDYSKIGTYYNDEVLVAYSNGLITGTDDRGTFNPQGTLNRAQAATVAIRLLDTSSRANVMSDADYYKEQAKVEAATGLTIYEGQQRTGRLAQAGDTVVKADGSKVVLKIGPNGVLGEGQGVAPNLGLIVVTNFGTAPIKHQTMVNELGMKDSLGNKLQGELYWINSLTGTGHFAHEWDVVTSEPTETGSEKDWQLSADKNWFFDIDMWVPVYSSNTATQEMIIDANGL